MKKTEGETKIKTEKGAKEKGEEQSKKNAEEDAKKKNEKECTKMARKEAKTTCRGNRFWLLTEDREQEDITWRCYVCSSFRITDPNGRVFCILCCGLLVLFFLPLPPVVQVLLQTFVSRHEKPRMFVQT